MRENQWPRAKREQHGDGPRQITSLQLTWPSGPAGCCADLQAGDLEGKALGAEGDQRSHDLLIGLLAERFPHDRVRSEEDDQAKELSDSAGRVWIIDPLDGTREYSERRTDWAVHVALAVDGPRPSVRWPCPASTWSSVPATHRPCRPGRTCPVWW